MNFFILKSPIQNICDFANPFCQANGWFSFLNSLETLLPVCALDILHIDDSRLRKIELGNLFH